MDDIRRMFDKFTPTTTTQPEQYKKFNPNPQPEYPVQNITPYPQYEEWKSMIEGGTLPSEFDMRPSEVSPMGMPTETGLPTEAGLPTEVPGELPTGIPEQFQPLMDFLGLTDPMELVDAIGDYTDKDLAFIMKLAGVKEEEEEEPLNYFDFTRKQAEDAYASGEWGEDEWDTWKKVQGDRKWLDELLEEEEEYTVADFVDWAVEDNKTQKDIIKAMVKAGWKTEDAISELQIYLGQMNIQLREEEE